MLGLLSVRGNVVLVEYDAVTTSTVQVEHNVYTVASVAIAQCVAMCCNGYVAICHDHSQNTIVIYLRTLRQ